LLTTVLGIKSISGSVRGFDCQYTQNSFSLAAFFFLQLRVRNEKLNLFASKGAQTDFKKKSEIM
jgi:hypothetical protein